MRNLLKNSTKDKNLIMTSTLLQQPSTHHKDWTNDRLRLTLNSNLNCNNINQNNNNMSNTSSNNNKKISSSDNSNGFKKAIMKMLVFDDSNSNSKSNSSSFTNFITNNGNNKTNMSLLKLFAINALELSAPASPVLLQQTNSRAPGWLQLSGHPESIAPAENGVVRKRVTNLTDSEVIAYRGLTKDIYASQLIPKYLGVYQHNGEAYIELEDLLHGFKDPYVMDIKMGCRTFSECEVTSQILRPDLYKKMMAVDPSAPTADEHELKAVTKLRYMMFREQLSSSSRKGFRIEALKMKGMEPITDLKTLRHDHEIESVISHFLNKKRHVANELIKCLKQMRNSIEKSEFFQTHEVIGSSIFIVYDDEHIGAWLIDFAKCSKIPNGVKIDHRKGWEPGNSEEGLLHGIDELIKTFEAVSK